MDEYSPHALTERAVQHSKPKPSSGKSSLPLNHKSTVTRPCRHQPRWNDRIQRVSTRFLCQVQAAFKSPRVAGRQTKDRPACQGTAPSARMQTAVSSTHPPQLKSNLLIRQWALTRQGTCALRRVRPTNQSPPEVVCILSPPGIRCFRVFIENPCKTSRFAGVLSFLRYAGTTLSKFLARTSIIWLGPDSKGKRASQTF